MADKSGLIFLLPPLKSVSILLSLPLLMSVSIVRPRSGFDKNAPAFSITPILLHDVYCASPTAVGSGCATNVFVVHGPANDDCDELKNQKPPASSTATTRTYPYIF